MRIASIYKCLVASYFSIISMNSCFSQNTKSKFLNQDSESVVDSTAAGVSGINLYPRGINSKFSAALSSFQFKGNKKSYSINSKWNEIFTQFTQIRSSDFSRINYSAKYANDDNYLIFVKDKIDSIAGLLFDDEFVILEKSLYFSSTTVLYAKYFNSEDSALNYFQKSKTKLFLLNKNDAESTGFWYRYNNFFITFELSGSNVFLNIKKDSPINWWDSMFYSYCLFNRPFTFREIDESNSFRGIKFATPYSVISSKFKLLQIKQSKHIYQPLDDFFKIWKDFSFNESVFFYFSDDNKLESVRLYFNNEEYAKGEVLQKLVDYFGDSNIKRGYGDKRNDIFSGMYYLWIGENINISLIDENKSYGTFITIKSNFVKAAKYIDY